MIRFVSIEKARKSKRSKRRSKLTMFKKHEALSNAIGRAMRVDLVHGITRFKNRISLDAIRGAWETGNYASLYTHVPWEKLPEDLEPSAKRMREAAGKSSELETLRMPEPVRRDLRFDLKNPAMKRYLDERTAGMVGFIEEDSRSVIRRAITRSFDQVRSPRAIALQVKDSIGLIPQHEIAVENYRLKLYSGGMQEDKADGLASKYADRLLDYRANMIARTEVRNATNHGQLSVWQAAGEQGLFNAERAVKEWVVDGNPCEICEPMDGKRVPLDDPWIIKYPDGETDEVDVPSESHPHCMCGMEILFEEDLEVEEDEED